MFTVVSSVTTMLTVEKRTGVRSIDLRFLTLQIWLQRPWKMEKIRKVTRNKKHNFQENKPLNCLIEDMN